MKLKRLLNKTLLLFFSIAFCLILLDGLLWLVHPLPSGQSAQWIWKHDIPGIKPEVAFEKYHDLRGLSWTEQSPLPKPLGTFRILCVGASTTESSQQAPKDAWWGLLEQRLQQEPEFAGKSDVAFPEHSDSDLPGMYRVRAFLRKVSQIYRHASAIRLRWNVARGLAVNWITAKDMMELAAKLRALPLNEPASRNPDPLPRFASGVHSTISVARQNNIPVLLLGQPVLWKEKMTEAEDSVRWFRHYEGQEAYQASGGWMYHEMQRFNDAQRQAAAETGSCFVNLDEVVPKSLDVYYDDCHYTDAGSIKVAEAVFPAVVECLHRK